MARSFFQYLVICNIEICPKAVKTDKEGTNFAQFKNCLLKWPKVQHLAKSCHTGLIIRQAT